MKRKNKIKPSGLETTEEKINELISECKSLDLTKKIGKDIEITGDWEGIIEKIILFKKFIKEVEGVADEKLLEAIRKNPNKISYEGERIKLLYYPKTKLTIEKDVDEKYTIIKLEPNKKSIEAFFKMYKKLPRGVVKETTYNIKKSLLKEI